MANKETTRTDGPHPVELPTLGKRAHFSYACDGGGLILYYGKASRLRLSADMMRRLCADNRGKMMAPTGADSLDEWLRTNGIQTRIVSYLAPALIHLGFAEHAGSKIRFRA